MGHLIACHGCDLLVDVYGLGNGSRANCPRCGHFLTRYQSDAMSRILAYAIAAIVFLVLAASFPFLSFSASGLESVMTLRAAQGPCGATGCRNWHSWWRLFIIYIPALLLLLMVSISIPLLFGLRVPWLRFRGAERVYLAKLGHG